MNLVQGIQIAFETRVDFKPVQGRQEIDVASIDGIREQGTTIFVIETTIPLGVTRRQIYQVTPGLCGPVGGLFHQHRPQALLAPIGMAGGAVYADGLQGVGTGGYLSWRMGDAGANGSIDPDNADVVQIRRPVDVGIIGENGGWLTLIRPKDPID